MCAGGVPEGTATQAEKPPSPRRSRPPWRLGAGEASPVPRKLPIQEFALGDARVLRTRCGLGRPGSRCPRGRVPGPAPDLVRWEDPAADASGWGQGCPDTVLREGGFPRRLGLCGRWALGQQSSRWSSWRFRAGSLWTLAMTRLPSRPAHPSLSEGPGALRLGPVPSLVAERGRRSGAGPEPRVGLKRAGGSSELGWREPRHRHPPLGPPLRGASN